MSHTVRWTIEKIQQRLTLLELYSYRSSLELPPFRLHLAADTIREALPIAQDVDDSNWPCVEPHSYWGEWRSHFILRSAFHIPQDWNAAESTALFLPLGESGDFSHPEALVLLDEMPYAACDRHHQEVLLPKNMFDGKPHQLTLFGWTGMGGWHNPTPGTKLFMRPCQVVRIDQPMRDFLATARVALGAAIAIDRHHPTRGHLLNALDQAFQQLDLREPRSAAFYESIPPAHETLRTGITQAGPALDVTVFATGHAHIDVAWLWPLAETRHKCQRTFHTVLRLMEQFPDYHFTQSQPQLYDFVRQDNPTLFEAIKTRVVKGRWETIGGMWVEADCNLSGPESLARQFVLGRRFFHDHFGPNAESPVLWLPDVFGYAWNLPQLIKQAGLEYFFTIKIGWNQYNRLPYDSFWWQGLDGTKVLTHFSATPDPGGHGSSTYNATATPEQNLGTWTNFQQQEFQHNLLMAFGYGDGGGGPTSEMLENIREMANFPAVPRMKQGSVKEFFQQMEAEAGERLPTWNGELYLELHRGTYTTQARNKRANRRSELLLHDAEFLASLAAVLDADYSYPADSLTQAWQLVCLNQFHDIIPGSSIGQVYSDSLAQYEEIRQIGEQVKTEALTAIRPYLKTEWFVVNPTAFTQSQLVFWPETFEPDQQIINSDDMPVAMQAVEGGMLLLIESLPPLSVTSLQTVRGDAQDFHNLGQLEVSVNPTRLENDFLRVEFNAEGDITRIFDKKNDREVLPEGALANQFLAFEDRPKKWDAWDIDIYYKDTCWLSDPAASITIVEQGPLRATLEITRRILHSEYTQLISLSCHSPELRFETTIDWRESCTLLKTAFPVEVLSPTATYEIQWGNVERPTHWNTSWDWARFETCAQKWVDLSEGGYGVSLLNDCKYGHDIKDNVLRLSLLRAPTAPDPNADRGEHHFTYSLLPHAGRWGAATIAAAYALNDPLLITRINSMEDTPLTSLWLTEKQSLIAADRENIVIETIKWAEDGDGLIVRFYESQRQRGNVTLIASFPIARAEIVNLLEETQEELAHADQQVTLSVKPYQIVTLRIVPGGAK